MVKRYSDSLYAVKVDNLTMPLSRAKALLEILDAEADRGLGLDQERFYRLEALIDGIRRNLDDVSTVLDQATMLKDQPEQEGGGHA